MSDRNELAEIIGLLSVSDEIKNALRILTAELSEQADQDELGELTWRLGETEDSRGIGLICCCAKYRWRANSGYPRGLA